MDHKKCKLIAEHAGWRNVRYSRGHPFLDEGSTGEGYNAWCGSPPNEALDQTALLPDFFVSLEAMKLVEDALDRETNLTPNDEFAAVLTAWDYYIFKLKMLIARTCEAEELEGRLISAAERAQAYYDMIIDLK